MYKGLSPIRYDAYPGYHCLEVGLRAAACRSFIDYTCRNHTGILLAEGGDSTIILRRKIQFALLKQAMAC